MGGKQKQAQRTKGNTRPSSSARAAEFLQQSGVDAAGGGFIGFSALSGDLGYVPAAQGSEEADNTVDADFRFVLRKISKRDATTKLKALQELSGLCKEKDSDLVKTVLPFWPRIYSKVSIDHDRRVREACQQAHEQLCLKVRRELAPHLKALMGAWVLAQCDAYAPAASAARAAFHAAFPPAKQSEAIAFCKEPIFNMMKDNLITHTAQTLSDPKCTEPEDVESKYLRVLSASLSALTMLLKSVAEKHADFINEQFGSLFAQSKFWKYAKHSNSQVSSAFYSLLSALCQNAPSTANQFADKLCPTVLHNLDLTDPIVVPALWECTLSVLKVIDDCWQKVNVRKGVLPKLWSVMKNGGAGSAVVICPHWLPLLSQVPQEVQGEGIGFYQEFFSNLRKGLSADGVQRSQRECNSIIKAFMECLKYTIQCNGNQELIHFLMSELDIVLKSSIEEKNTVLYTTCLYIDLAALVSHLHKRANEFDAETLQCLVELLGNIITTYEVSSDASVLQRLSTLLLAFSESKPLTSAKKPSVSFGEEMKKKESNDIDQSLFCREPLIRNIILMSITNAHTRNLDSEVNVRYYCGLLTMFMSTEMVTYLAEKLSPTSELPLIPSCFSVSILPLADKYSDSHTMTSIVAASNAFFTLCESSDKCLFLDLLLKDTKNGDFLNDLLTQIMNSSNDKSVQKWFHGQTFGQRMVEVAKELCEESLKESNSDGNKLESQWSLMKLALSVDRKNDPVLGDEYLSVILSLIRQSLPSLADITKANSSMIQKCVTFVCRVAENFFSHARTSIIQESSVNLLVALFSIDCHRPATLNCGCMEHVRTTWTQGVRNLVQQQGGYVSKEETNFFNIATKVIKAAVMNDAYTVEKLNWLCDVAVHLLKCVLTDDMQGFNHEIILPLLHSIKMHNMEPLLPSHWSLHPMYTGQISLDTPSTAKQPMQYSILPQSVLPMTFYSTLLLKTVLASDGCVLEAVRVIYCAAESCYAFTLCQNLLALDSKAKHSSEIEKVSAILKGNITQLIKHLTDDEKLKFLDIMITKCLSRSTLWSMWALALRSLINFLSPYTNLNLMQTIGSLDRFAESCNSLRAILPALNSPQVMEIANTRAAILMTIEKNDIAAHDKGIGHLNVFRHCLVPQNQSFTIPFGAESPIEAEVVKGLLTQIQSWREQHEDLFLFDSNLESIDWNVVSFNREIAHLMADLVTLFPKELSAEHWDFILCSLVSWTQTCCESKSSLSSDPKCQSLAVAVFHLVSCVSSCMKSVLPESPSDFPDNLSSEWSEFFSQGAYELIIPLFVDLATSSSVTLGENYLLPVLSSAVSLCPSAHLEAHSLPAKLVADDESGLPDHLQTLLNHVCPLLLCSHRPVQIAAFNIIRSVMPALTSVMNVELENDQTIDEEKTEKERETKSPPEALMSALDLSSQTVEFILHSSVMGETVLIEPNINEHNLTFGYLLTWNLLLDFVQTAPSQLRAEYAEHLKSSLVVDVLLSNLFRLMPQSPLVELRDSLTSPSVSQPLSTTSNLFESAPLLNMHSNSSSQELQHLACAVYSLCLKDLPAVLRQWWNGLDRHTARIVEEYTVKFVSPFLTQEEIASVQLAAESRADDNLKVKGRPVAREVVATFQMEEVTMELLVQLPLNYPLGAINVETVRRVGVATSQWRNWMLQLTTFLMHQNGSIMDGLALWKKNVDKRFEGIEDCMICFSVIHGTTAQVPKLKCKTCKKKFHSACLYKWFNSSNNTACPLCRNLF